MLARCLLFSLNCNVLHPTLRLSIAVEAGIPASSVFSLNARIYSLPSSQYGFSVKVRRQHTERESDPSLFNSLLVIVLYSLLHCRLRGIPSNVVPNQPPSLFSFSPFVAGAAHDRGQSIAYTNGRMSSTPRRGDR